MVIRVLLVDDYPATRKLLRDNLSLCCPGAVVVGEACNGKEGLRLAQQLQPDVVLMDIRMPVMDGIEATAAITRLQLPTRIITYTGFSGQQLADKAKAAGAFCHLRKPFDLIRLGAEITAAAGASTAEASAAVK